MKITFKLNVFPNNIYLYFSDYSSYKNNTEDNDVAIPAEKKRKIRDKLRQFFVRRPTLESLREKGILIGMLNFYL